jgi:hypothetical protein
MEGLVKRHRSLFIRAGALYLLALLPALHGARAIHGPSPSESPVRSQELPSLAIYDSDPKHTWNRIFQEFYVRQDWDGRTYGGDQLDPYLWEETKYLIEGPSHKQALALLDEFLSTHAERLITDPLKRAMFQHDLWGVFSWSTRLPPERHAAADKLEEKLVQVMRRVALTSDQIRALPDNYAAAISRLHPPAFNAVDRTSPFLPPDLLNPKGPWVCMGIELGKPAAGAHTDFFGGRSVFLVFLHLPGGREATLAYLRELHDFPAPMIAFTEDFFTLMHTQGKNSGGVGRGFMISRVPNPNLPQFPIGSQVALVRRMALIDDHGDWASTPVTESVQLRVFTGIPSRDDWIANRADASQDSFEFRLRRADLFAGEAGGFHAITKSEMEFPVFLSMPFDWLTQRFDSAASGGHDSSSSSTMLRPILDSCAGCHAAPGIHSILNPRTMWSGLKDSPSLFFESSPEEQIAVTSGMAIKKQEWVKLRQFWK